MLPPCSSPARAVPSAAGLHISPRAGIIFSKFREVEHGSETAGIHHQNRGGEQYHPGRPEKLYITQSALNQQLLRLERELGTPLFYRSPHQLAPHRGRGRSTWKTPKKYCRSSMRPTASSAISPPPKRAPSPWGSPPAGGSICSPPSTPPSHQQYPDITVEPREMSVRSQQHEIAQGRLDIGFMTLRESDRTGDVYQVIGREEFVLAIPEGHPLGAMAAPAGKPLAVMDLARLKYEPFVFMYRGVHQPPPHRRGCSRRPDLRRRCFSRRPSTATIAQPGALPHLLRADPPLLRAAPAGGDRRLRPGQPPRLGHRGELAPGRLRQPGGQGIHPPGRRILD